MSTKFEKSVARNLRGVHFFSTGACPGCDECGLADKDCNECDGAGTIFVETHKPGLGTFEMEIPCTSCGGKGKIVPTEKEIESAGESSFSWSQCDSCSSYLGGDRHPAHGVIADSIEKAQSEENKITHFDICTDCALYHANGELPE